MVVNSGRVSHALPIFFQLRGTHMTSGQFTSFIVSNIRVEREERQRKELKGIDELAQSIQRVGLIHPLVIERDGRLRAGERRLTAVKQLGWEAVSVQFVDELDEAQLQLLELEENIRREQLPWQDECQAVQHYHELRLSMDPDWTQTKTAEALGMSQQNVGQKMDVAAELRRGNTRITEAPKFSVARGIVGRVKERREKANAETITGYKTKTEERVAPIEHADFLQWLTTYEGPQFNFIHCDFPYGIGSDTHDQAAHPAYGGFKDDFETYENLIDGLRAADHLINESAHLMFWFSMEFYEHTRTRLEDCGWDVQRFPIYWVKSDNVGVLPDPSRGPRRIVETAFIASRGDRKVVRPVSNAVVLPTSKRIHMSEKPLAVLTHFFRMFVDEYSNVLDPTCGSGNALRVAQELKANYVLGLEINEEFHKLAKEHFFDPV